MKNRTDIAIIPSMDFSSNYKISQDSTLITVYGYLQKIIDLEKNIPPGPGKTGVGGMFFIAKLLHI